MPSRFEYERAIRLSDLPPLSRLVALTVATWAEVSSGDIPDWVTPSLTTLEESTGMARASVRKHLDTLEAGGWILRDRPDPRKARSEKARTKYGLAIPTRAAPALEGKPEEVGQEGGLGQETPQAGAGDALALGQEMSTTRAGAALKSSPPSEEYLGSTSSVRDDEIPGQTCLIAAAVEADADKPRGAAKKKRAAKPKKPNPHSVADELTDAFWKHHGAGRAQSFIAIRGVIRTAIGNGVARNDLARALDTVAREGRSVSGATLDIALGQRTHKPYANPADPSVYDEDFFARTPSADAPDYNEDFFK